MLYRCYEVPTKKQSSTFSTPACFRAGGLCLQVAVNVSTLLLFTDSYDMFSGIQDMCGNHMQTKNEDVVQYLPWTGRTDNFVPKVPMFLKMVKALVQRPSYG
jgi:hypothetical protein